MLKSPERVAKIRCRRHEGCKLYPYPDHGHYSIGYGCQLLLKPPVLDAVLAESKGDWITKDDADALFKKRWMRAKESATTLCREHNVGVEHAPSGTARVVLSAIQFFVLVEMCYQMGLGGVRGFRKMWKALAAGNMETAHDEMLDSEWALNRHGRGTPQRANTLAVIFFRDDDDS